MSPPEAVWFDHILSKGCAALSPKGKTPIEFVVSGKGPDVSKEELDGCIRVF